MFSKCKSILFLFIIIFGIIACTQALYIPSLADSQNAQVSIDTLVMGRELYVKNCSSCHNLYLPERFTSVEWEKLIPEMQIRAKISNEEASKISIYLKAHSKTIYPVL
jgi:hypothetical protein